MFTKILLFIAYVVSPVDNSKAIVLYKYNRPNLRGFNTTYIPK